MIFYISNNSSFINDVVNVHNISWQKLEVKWLHLKPVIIVNKLSFNDFDGVLISANKCYLYIDILDTLVDFNWHFNKILINKAKVFLKKANKDQDWLMKLVANIDTHFSIRQVIVNKIEVV